MYIEVSSKPNGTLSSIAVLSFFFPIWWRDRFFGLEPLFLNCDSGRHPLSADDIRSGVSRILQGLFLKVVLADSIAEFVNLGFATDASSLSAFDAWTLAFLFGFQIYFDFAGYSHIAIGSARLLGITLPENFDFPYLATSPRDFWRRWHISLTNWISRLCLSVDDRKTSMRAEKEARDVS